MFKKNGKTTTLGVVTTPKDNKEKQENKPATDNQKPQDKKQK